MNRTALLTAVAAVLLLANLAMVTMLFLDRKGRDAEPPRKEHRGPRNIIIQRLDFDGVQTEAYDLLIADHRANIRELDHKMMEVRNGLYSGLSSGDTAHSDSLFALVGGLQQDVEKTHLRHFADIRDLCREEQLPRFHELTRDLGGLFAHPRPPRPPKR